MKAIIKKIIASILINLIAFSFLSIKEVKAENLSPWYYQSFPEWFSKVYDDTNPTEIFGERYTAAQVQWIFYSIISLIFYPAKELIDCAFSGDLNQCKNAITNILANNNNFQNNKAVATKKEKSASFWNFLLGERDLSGISYTKKIIGNLSIAPEAKAESEGYGYRSLSFIQPMWKNIRNTSYFFLIIATILAAFLIMFRVKISPQVVLTVQNLLPKIVITILLATFSYAIAGFLIDLMYVVFAVIFKTVFASSWDFNFAWLTFTGSSFGIIAIFIVYSIFFSISLFLGFLYWISSGIINQLAAIGGLAPVIILIVFLFLLVLVLMLIINFFKIVFMLLKNIAELLITIIFSPLSIALSVATGNSPTDFIKKIASKLAVFIGTAVLMFLALDFANLAALVSLEETIGENFYSDLINFLEKLPGIGHFYIFKPGFHYSGGIWNPPFFGTGMMGLVLSGVSFAIMAIVPKAADIIKAAIEGKPFAYGAAIGEAVGPARTIGATTFAGRYAYYTSTPPSETSGPIHKIIGGIYQKAGPQAKNMLDQSAKNIQGIIQGK